MPTLTETLLILTNFSDKFIFEKNYDLLKNLQILNSNDQCDFTILKKTLESLYDLIMEGENISRSDCTLGKISFLTIQALAARYKINDCYPLEIRSKNLITISTGEQFDIFSLIKWQSHRDPIKKLNEKKNWKWLLNPIDKKSFFSIKDEEYILEIAKQKKIKLENLNTLYQFYLQGKELYQKEDNDAKFWLKIPAENGSGEAAFLLTKIYICTFMLFQKNNFYPSKINKYYDLILKNLKLSTDNFCQRARLIKIFALFQKKDELIDEAEHELYNFLVKRYTSIIDKISSDQQGMEGAVEDFNQKNISLTNLYIGCQEIKNHLDKMFLEEIEPVLNFVRELIWQDYTLLTNDMILVSIEDRLIQIADKSTILQGSLIEYLYWTFKSVELTHSLNMINYLVILLREGRFCVGYHSNQNLPLYTKNHLFFEKNLLLAFQWEKFITLVSQSEDTKPNLNIDKCHELVDKTYKHYAITYKIPDPVILKQIPVLDAELKLNAHFSNPKLPLSQIISKLNSLYSSNKTLESGKPKELHLNKLKRSNSFKL